MPVSDDGGATYPPFTPAVSPVRYVTDTQAGTSVQKAGDTMTGDLILPGNPAEPLGAAPQQYVDASLVTATGRAAAFALVLGG